MRNLSAMLALTLLVVCSAVRAGNPMYDSWARHGVGTSVTMKGVSDMMGNKSETEVTSTLLEKSPEKVVVELKMSTVMGGQKMDMPATKMEFAANAPAVDPAAQAVTEAAKPETKESEESITVAGKEYKAKVTEVTMKQGDMTTWSKNWTSPDFPGMSLKSVTRTDGQMKTETTMEATGVSIK